MPALNRVDPGHRRSTRRWPALYGRSRAVATKDRGYTLFEIVLVLAILVVFAALAAPRYGRASARYRADLAARRIAADLRLARACAKAASASRTVSFSVATKQYQLLNVPAPDGVAGDYTVVLSSDPYRANLVSTSFNNAQVVFSGWGLPDNGGTVVVSAGSEQRTVVVEAGTGRVSIQ